MTRTFLMRGMPALVLCVAVMLLFGGCAMLDQRKLDDVHSGPAASPRYSRA